jgi:membrane dipeptidase
LFKLFKLNEEQEKRASRIHDTSFVFDAHCDTILSILKGERSLGERSDLGHIDLPRLKEGGINAQTFAVFVCPEWYNDAAHSVMKAIAVLKRELQKNSNVVGLARTGSDIRKIYDEGKTVALLSIEGGEALQADIDMLDIYKELGVTSITLTWNNRNAIADGALDLRSGGGISDFGVEVIKQMEQLGILIDLSHISPNGFWDVMEIATKPVIVSHSLPRKFMDIPRNLDDKQIKAIAQKDGVIGASFYVSSYGESAGDIEDILDAIDHFVNIAGVEHVGLGSDFDGISENVEGIESCEKMINITRGMVYRGYSDEEIQKILGGNFLRIFEQVIG